MGRYRNRKAYKYDPKYHDAWVFSLAIKGATDDEIAEAFGVNRRTVERWSKTTNENGDEILSSFGEARRSGKEQADAQVVKKLYERCMGYESTEVNQTIDHDAQGRMSVRETRTTKKHIVPDTMAIMYWLNNRSRMSGEWSQRQDVNVSLDEGRKDVVIYLPAKETDDDDE
jgi:transposase